VVFTHFLIDYSNVLALALPRNCDKYKCKRGYIIIVGVGNGFGTKLSQPPTLISKSSRYLR
jgi:hypothetical protein